MKDRFCCKCSDKLVSGENWSFSREKKHENICKDCHNLDSLKEGLLNRDKHRLLSKRRYNNHKHDCSGYKKVYSQEHKDRVSAKGKVHRALKSGKLVKPFSCSNCGRSDCFIEGHHDDYSKPLNVRWLCSSCHRFLHHDWLLRKELDLDSFGS